MHNCASSAATTPTLPVCRPSCRPLAHARYVPDGPGCRACPHSPDSLGDISDATTLIWASTRPRPARIRARTATAVAAYPLTSPLMTLIFLLYDVSAQRGMLELSFGSRTTERGVRKRHDLCAIESE